MSTVTDLERKVQSLKDQLHEAERSLYNARLAECPIKAGALVRSSRFNGTTFKVAEIEFKSWGSIWLSGYRQLKDGSFSTALNRLFDDYEVLA